MKEDRVKFLTKRLFNNYQFSMRSKAYRGTETSFSK